MTPDLLHRIRWTNVARAAALLLAILLALAWPRLRSHADPLPPAVAAPAAEAPAAGEDASADADAEAPAEAAQPPAARTRASRPAAPHARAKKPGRRRRRAVRAKRPVARGAAGQSVAVAPAPTVPTWRPPPRSSPAAEFRP